MKEKKEKSVKPDKIPPQNIEPIEEAIHEIEKVSRLLVLRNCVLSLSMPGASSGVVTKTFREGQIIYDPCSIEQLLANDMPVEILQ
jgi:hypothetical protein